MSETSQPIQVLDVFNKQNFHTGVASEFVKFPKAQSTVTMPNGVKFGDGSFQNSASTGSSLTVQEASGANPEIATEVSTIKVSNGTLTVDPNDNSIVTISTSGGSGSGSLTVTDNNVTSANVSTINVEALGTVVNDSATNTAFLFSGGSKVSSTQTYTTTALTNHQFLIDPFNTTNVTTSGVTSSGLVSSYTGAYKHDATVITDNLGIRHLEFDGLGDYIDFATSSNLIDAIPDHTSASPGNFTMWGWFSKGDDTNETIISTLSRTGSNGSYDGKGVELRTQGTYAIRIGSPNRASNNGFYSVDTTVEATEGWHMFGITAVHNGAGTDDAYDYTFYVDGVSIYTYTGEFFTPTSGVYIGAFNTIVNYPASNSSVTTSNIGHCGITNSALSSTDFTSIYNELKPYYLTTGLFAGDLTGNVTGDVTGNVTGNVTGDVTGNVTGDVTGNADTVTNGVYTNTNSTISGTITANEFLGPLTGDVTGDIKTTNSATSASITGSSTLSLQLSGNTYDTFHYNPTSGSAAITISTIEFASTGTAPRVNSQIVISIKNQSTQTVEIPTTIAVSDQAGGSSTGNFLVNFSSQVDIPNNGYGIITIYYLSSTLFFASASVFS